MFSIISRVVGSNGLMARVARSASWIILGYGGSQAMRLVSNLILTRLLFPEAFGLMALLTVVTVGLTMFSDVGISPSISQSKRGDDPDFLNTAWTIQVIRGCGLWILACALAYPMALFYDQPDLVEYLPIAALSLLVAGFNPTSIETANRHLLMGRLTMLDLLSQFIALVLMVVMALIWKSVAALVVGSVLGALAKLVLTWAFLPGPRNRFHLEKTAMAELISFGKWIFLSTVFWFFASQGDKAILGKFLSLEVLGIYNIGYFLASFAVLLGMNVSSRVMIPVYREAAGTPRVTKLRYLLSTGASGLLVGMAIAGPWLVDLLYDDRYLLSGAIIVVLSVGFIPLVMGLTYDQAALAAGDSRRFFVYNATRSTLQVALLLVGAFYAGLIGAIVGMGISMVLSHFLLIWLARAHNAWDGKHDLIFAVIGSLAGGFALWLHWDAILALSALS